VVNNISPFFKQKYLGFVTFLFFLTRVPLLKNHFFHCDDSAGLATYPIFSKIIGYFSWYSSELMHYKLFPKTPSFVFENILSRSFSLFMAFCSLWILLIIIKKLFKNDYLTLFIGVIICCSQMSIIYSIHSGPYGYSTLSIGLMMLYILDIKNNHLHSRNLNLLIICLILCPFIDVFSIFIIPVFLIIILLKFESGKFTLNIGKKNLIVSLGLVFSCFFVILFHIIPLKKAFNRPLATHWNKGINNQYVIHRDSIYDLILEPLETSWFYIKNLMLVFENNLSPMDCFNIHLENTVAIVVSLFALPILFTGAFKLKKIDFKLLLFLILSLVFFFFLIYLNILALSPTRHNLWLNATFIILIAAALHKLNKKIIILISIAIGFVTAITYISFFKNREAKISYSYLKKLESKCQIDYFIDYTIYSKEWFSSSQNISKLFINKNLRAFKESSKSTDSILVFCLINHRPIDNLRNTSSIKKLINLNYVVDMNNIKKKILGEKSLYEKYVFSDTEFGRSKFCSNGTNGIFMKIIEVNIK